MKIEMVGYQGPSNDLLNQWSSEVLLAFYFSQDVVNNTYSLYMIAFTSPCFPTVFSSIDQLIYLAPAKRNLGDRNLML